MRVDPDCQMGMRRNDNIDTHRASPLNAAQVGCAHIHTLLDGVSVNRLRLNGVGSVHM